MQPMANLLPEPLRLNLHHVLLPRVDLGAQPVALRAKEGMLNFVRLATRWGLPLHVFSVHVSSPLLPFACLLCSGVTSLPRRSTAVLSQLLTTPTSTHLRQLHHQQNFVSYS